MEKRGRYAYDVPAHLRGAYVHIEGAVIVVLNTNPYTQSSNKNRQKRYLLSPVYLAGIEYDHLWVFGCYDTRYVKEGDRISFFARVSTYGEKEKKWCCKFPYTSLKISRYNR